LRDQVGAHLDTSFLESFFRPTYSHASKGAAFNIRQGAAHSLPDNRWVHATRSATTHYISHSLSGCTALRYRNAFKDAASNTDFGSTKASIEQDSRKCVGVRNPLTRLLLVATDVLNPLLSALCDT
jgi:hypothetical protein